MISGLPTVSEASLPTEVRRGTTQDKQDYKTALGFEQMLVGELVKSMAGTTGPLAEGPYASQMQDTMSSALVGGSGFGLAQQLYKEMQS
jgi:Rod binding domain-containing protein